MDKLKWVQKKRLYLSLLVTIFIILAFLIFLNINKRNSSQVQAPTEESSIASNQLIEEYEKNKEINSDPFVKMESEYNESIEKLSNLNELDETEQYNYGLVASFNGAKLNKPEASKYASELLDRIPKDVETQTLYIGIIEMLVSISKGDYSVVE
jgi:hypothetical protein